MELDKSMLYVETAEGKDIELLYQLCKKQSYEEFCLWGADFVYDYPPNLAQMKQSYASRKRMLLYRVIFQERIIGFAELDQIQENRSDAVLARVVLEPETWNIHHKKHIEAGFLHIADGAREPGCLSE